MRPKNEWFRPELLGRLRNVYVVLVLSIVGVPIAIVGYLVTPLVSVGVAAVAIAALTVFVWYNRAFERSAAYRLTAEEIQYRRGVWIRKQSEVPFRRITNVTTSEGPIQRWVGTGSVEIHTAGRSTQVGAEMRVQGVEDFEEVTEQVMNEVREHRSGAEDEGEAPIEAAGPVSVTGDEDLLDEVRRIRELIESGE
ncbi:MAG: membrane protein YdbS with pleckstrin-like domain [Halobacteriales archaeon]|jgi:membrane protein YdbS with pleckstrin-like domain